MKHRNVVVNIWVVLQEKNSGVGKQVQERMKKEGKLRETGGKKEVLGEDGNWYPIENTDMGHIESAVDYWNREGYKHGPKSPEVRKFMTNPDNYELEPYTLNRSKGGKTGARYRKPLGE